MANENNTPRKISRSEKTNAKNQEYLHVVNVTIEPIEIFDPTNPLILKAALVDYEAGFAQRLQATNAAVAAEDAAIEAQTVAFKLVGTKVTRILSAVKAQGISTEQLAHLMTTVRSLRGVTVTKKTPDANAAGDIENAPKHSNSQQSIAGILENLDLLDEQVGALVNYKPNEAEFKKETISAWIAGLHTIHNNRLEAQANTVNARHNRDAYGYGEEGIIVRMNLLKSYLATILDKNDPRYKKIKALKFVDTTNK